MAKARKFKTGDNLLTFKDEYDPHFDRGTWNEVQDHNQAQRDFIGGRTFTRYVSEGDPRNVFLIIHDRIKTSPVP